MNTTDITKTTLDELIANAKPGSMPLNMRRAKEAGWTPKPLTTPKAYACGSGCGRLVVHDATDDTCGYLCHHCTQASKAYLARKKREQSTIVIPQSAD